MTEQERADRYQEFVERNARQILDLLIPAVKAGKVKVGPELIIDPESAVGFLRDCPAYWELMADAQLELTALFEKTPVVH